MLWSPSEVLAYIKDDKSCEDIDKRHADILLPTTPYGGFKTWPNLEEDFILLAENSEIHGPNPLFTIPDVKHKLDLNLISTQILSADYQGLGNNKILPGKNAQLVMPDIDADSHAAIVYFFLFDSEARGFIRPTCVAYFTSDKYKLVMLAEFILKRLTEISSILQHFNIICAAEDLNSLKESLALSEKKLSKSEETANEILLKDIQEILDIINEYKGNELHDKQLIHVLDLMKKNTTSETIQKWISNPLFKSPSDSHKRKFLHRSNSKTCMKDLYQICDKGILLGLYHLHITYKYLRRKYENIAILNGNSLKKVSENKSASNEYCLYFGVCVQNISSKKENSLQNDCMFSSLKVPSTFACEEEKYFSCLDTEFETVIESFLSWGTDFNSEDPINSSDHIYSTSEDAGSSEFCNNGSSGCEQTCDNIAGPKNMHVQIYCGHIVPLSSIWDSSEYLIKQHPDAEKAFSKILKLFNDSERLFFSVLTRLPIVILPHQSEDALNFILALSIFIPRSKRETVFVDINRHESLTMEDCNKFAAILFCLENFDNMGDLIPLELMSSVCILNLKECSLTAPSYSGRLLADIDLRLKALPVDGIIFPVVVGFLSKIELVIKWWHQITSSTFDASDISSLVLSKGYTRSDMQIIEKLYELWKN